MVPLIRVVHALGQVQRVLFTSGGRRNECKPLSSRLASSSDAARL